MFAYDIIIGSKEERGRRYGKRMGKRNPALLELRNENGGMFKYGQARDAGFSKREAGRMSKRPWKEIKDKIENAKKNKGGR